MKNKREKLFLLLVLLASFFVDLGNVASSERIGSSHVAGKYFFDSNRNFLNEGAIEIANMGMRVIKVWFQPNVGGFYTWNSNWPESFPSLTAIADHPYFCELFKRPFDTYILTITDPANFHDGFPDPNPENLEQDFYDLSRHLLETYSGTGKTFILDHWEGDWLLRNNTNTLPEYDPTSSAIEGMIR